MKSSTAQQELFARTALPDGFVYEPDFLTPEEETRLRKEIEQLPLGAQQPTR